MMTETFIYIYHIFSASRGTLQPAKGDLHVTELSGRNDYIVTKTPVRVCFLLQPNLLLIFALAT